MTEYFVDVTWVDQNTSRYRTGPFRDHERAEYFMIDLARNPRLLCAWLEVDDRDPK